MLLGRKIARSTYQASQVIAKILVSTNPAIQIGES